ncbi:MAG: hypothetical protein A2Z78_01305 [Candidatus Nealsonbacteria bacterium RBG_13_36_15]|uniref:Uncharacterized protein n=1 Tax=Candidatus Nealsonbacteria bacterium RBG_13_36_15 TaxID=1801660 RepID=A0A1G2DUS4_9BACT|nr:MAG: hypothetical protein A2Z78_01305 [Candidatus Nealsonbacteria bacterium RBG_13_36_15]
MIKIAIFLSLILGVVHFWNEKIFFRASDAKVKTMSFIAGASVTYVFLYLLPDLYKSVAYINQWVFIFILLGFSLVHLLEKYFYQRTEGQERLLRFKEIHFFIFFLYYFVIGIVLAGLLEINVVKSLLFFIPVLFYAAVSRISFEEINIRVREQKVFRILLALAALLGVLSAPVILEHLFLYHIFLAFIIGAFFYVAIMDFIPKEAKGKPEYFLLGVCLYTFLIMLTWVI